MLEKLKSLYEGWKDNRISTRKQSHLINVKQRWNLTLKQRWFGVGSKKQFCYYVKFLNVKVEKITVFERRNNFTLSTLNQQRSFTLKQRWFWVDSKNQFCSYIMTFEKLESLNQRQKDDRISTSKQFSLRWSPVSWKLGPYACNFAKRIAPS